MMYPEDDVLLTAGMDVVVLTRLLLYGEPAVQNVLKHRLSCPLTCCQASGSRLISSKLDFDL